MACVTCREKRLHKQINGRSLLMHDYISFHEVIPVLKTHGVKYTYVRSSGIAFLRVCMCELTQALVNDLKLLKSGNRSLPIMYY